MMEPSGLVLDTLRDLLPECSIEQGLGAGHPSNCGLSLSNSCNKCGASWYGSLMALHSVAHRSLTSEGYHGQSYGVERSGWLRNIGVSTLVNPISWQKQLQNQSEWCSS